jgi:predicted ATPase
MNIQAIRLRNFRGFHDVTLELKPLTVLLGPNSSGKSSFSYALAAMAHCQQIYEGRRDASLTPRKVEEANDWPIDLGLHPDLVNSGSKEKVFIGLCTSQGWAEFGFGRVPSAPDPLWLSHITLPQNIDVTPVMPTVSDEKASAQGQIVRPPGNSASGVQPYGGKLTELKETRLILERINEQQWQHEGQAALVGLDGLLPVSLQHSGGTEIKLNRKAVTDIQSLLQSVVYLRATRRRPSRGYEHFRSEQNSIGYEGERTASVLLNRANQRNAFTVPPPPASAKNLNVNWEAQESTLPHAAANWLHHLRLATSLQVRESERYGPEYVEVRVGRKSTGPTRDITEVGFGVSQVLPIIVGALLQPKEGLFIVDLPEAHLHPRPQGDIADLFCSLAMSGRSALVETHSEMFFHRLRLRAAMDQRVLDNVAVYFLDAPKEDGICSIPRKVGLTFEEEPQWPAGFLTEAMDSEVQINAVRQDRGKASR